MSISYADVAKLLSEIGVVKFGGFKLRIHQTNPDAPLSPYYLSFRRLPRGPLDDYYIGKLTKTLYDFASSLGLRFDAVSGVPNAGDPFAAVLAGLANVPLIQLAKHDEGEERHIVGVVPERRQVLPRSRVLLIDDLITHGDTKREAVLVLREAGCIVTDTLVFVDREQGGFEELARESVAVRAIWRISELFRFYRELEMINEETYRKAVLYLEANR